MTPDGRRQTFSEAWELLGMQLRDLGWALGTALDLDRWFTLPDCPDCHLLGVTKRGTCRRCLPTQAAFEDEEFLA